MLESSSLAEGEANGASLAAASVAAAIIEKNTNRILIFKFSIATKKAHQLNTRHGFRDLKIFEKKRIKG